MEKFTTEIGGRELTVELRDLAHKANGSCLVRYGDTVIMAAAVMSDQEREGIDFFPLTVEYEEKFYAAGKILGSRFTRREGKSSDEAIITGRYIDRAIRPRFKEHIRREIQVVITCLAWDRENDPGLAGLIGASVALSTSDIPWTGPISAVRIGKEDGKFVLNPNYEQRKNGKLDFLVAGMESEKDFLVNMIEFEADNAKEDEIMEAYEFAKPQLQELIKFQKDIVKKAGKEKVQIPEPEKDLVLENEIADFIDGKLEEALFSGDNDKKMANVDALRKELVNFIEGKYPETGKSKYADDYFENKINEVVHENIIKKERRIDGRKLDEVRPLSTEVALLPRVHGSALFTRGETKALSVLTLGGPEDVKLNEGIGVDSKKRFMHHYNFPPYSSGEVKPMRGPGRREIGHGMLAEKALSPLIPDQETFPYTIRAVTEIVCSNGSSSMASVSAACMAMMDGGVPLKSMAAGIAMGLMSNDQGEYKVVADIQGPEDHHGDMDFKVAGTKEGVNAIQLDVKVDGVTGKIMQEALEIAKKCREKIMKEMEKAIPEPRKELSKWAPRIHTLRIDRDKIKDVIGSGGKVINEIVDTCGVSMNVEEDGLVSITGENSESVERAVKWVESIVKEVQVGEKYQGKVKRILSFGAFVEILPGKEGLVHISQLAPRRVEKVEDVVKIGDTVNVKVISIDNQGRINLSMKDVPQA